VLSSVERLAHLEGRIVEHSQMFVRLEDRLTALDVRFDRVDARFDRVEGEISGLRRDLATQFRWTTSMVLTGFIAIFAAIIAR
jgi:hypothetical protein